VLAVTRCEDLIDRSVAKQITAYVQARDIELVAKGMILAAHLHQDSLDSCRLNYPDYTHVIDNHTE
jgi:hypothetical protein